MQDARVVQDLLITKRLYAILGGITIGAREFASEECFAALKAAFITSIICSVLKVAVIFHGQKSVGG